MAHVTTESPDERPVAIVRASDAEKNGTQVAVLCQIADNVSPYLISAPDIGKTVEVDPVAKAEALRTFELAQAQLRNIIDTQERWTLHETTAEAAATKLIDAQRLKQEAQVRLIEKMNAPHQLLKANIRRFAPGPGWVAWVGDHPLPQTTDLHGVGNSPAQAYAAFDRAHAQLMDLAALQRAQNPAPTPTSPPPAIPPKIPPKRRGNRKQK